MLDRQIDSQKDSLDRQIQTDSKIGGRQIDRYGESETNQECQKKTNRYNNVWYTTNYGAATLLKTFF